MDVDWAGWIAKRSLQIRDLPDDFGLDAVDDGKSVKLAKRFDISLGFEKSGDPEKDKRMLHMLRLSVWEALELKRLGLPLGHPAKASD